MARRRIRTAVIAGVAYIISGLGALYLVQRALHIAHCPADSFVSRLALNAYAAMTVGVLAFCLTAVSSVIFWMPAGGDDRTAAKPYRRSFWPLLLALELPIVGGACWLALGSKLCLADAGIIQRATTMAPVRRYTWSQITGLQTTCLKSGHGYQWRATFNVGKLESFTLGEREYAGALTHLREVLDHVPYDFASSDLEMHCLPATAGLFATRPSRP